MLAQPLMVFPMGRERSSSKEETTTRVTSKMESSMARASIGSPTPKSTKDNSSII